MNSKYLAVSLAVIVASPAALAAEYVIDQDHSYVGFQARHVMISNTRGHFKKYEGNVKFDDKAPDKTEINVVIDTASIDTNLAKRDDHLRSPDFLDAAKFPKLTFKSKKVKVTGKKMQIVGDLTIKDVTKEVTLDVAEFGKDTKDPWGGVRRSARATSKLSRKDFGMTWNVPMEAGGVALGDEVLLEFEIELIQKKEQKA